MNKSIFRSYDIRGIYPNELNEQTAYTIGRALYEYLGGVNTVAVGRDARTMAPSIQRAMMAGLADSGAKVTDLGMTSSDTRSFVTGKLGYELGISITASHNPKEWIGLKMAKAGGIEIGGGGEIAEIAEIALRLAEDETVYDPSKEYEFVYRDITNDWIEHVLSFTDKSKIAPMKVVVDAGNGVAGPMIEALASHLPLKIIPMYFEPDGGFPNHLPSPIEPENTEDLRARVVAERADLGMAFDGDADRVFLVDETGRLVTGSEMTAMIIDALLQEDPSKTVLYNAICGWNVRDVLARYPLATSHRTKVGHGYIKKDMVTYKADFAGEHSGHYFFKHNFNADSGLVATVVVLGLISSKSQKLSDILATHRKYAEIPETNFKVSDAKSVMERLAEEYKEGQIDWLDGLTVSFPDWWMNVRPSSNEPLLRLNLQAVNPEILKDKTHELTARIEQLGQSVF